jgi:hypothetical protein
MRKGRCEFNPQIAAAFFYVLLKKGRRERPGHVGGIPGI